MVNSPFKINTIIISGGALISLCTQHPGLVEYAISVGLNNEDGETYKDQWGGRDTPVGGIPIDVCRKGSVVWITSPFDERGV